MIEFGYAALALIAVPLFRTAGIHGYEEAKDQLFIVLTGLAATAGILYGFPALTPGPVFLFFAFVAFLSLSVLWSDNPLNSIQDMPRWWALFWFFLCCRAVPPDLLLPAVFLPAPFVAAYGIVQQVWFLDPLDEVGRGYIKEHRKKTSFLTWLGNANYSGAYLAPMVYVGLHLACTGSWLWGIPLALVIAGIGLSRCRAAWAGAMMGFAVMPGMWPYVAVLAVPIGLIGVRRLEPIVSRWIYLQICYEIWKKKPLFGWGPRVFRRKMFRAQADMNAKDRSLLGDLDTPPRNPLPLGKRSHNEYSETLIEGGILGLVLFLAWIGSTIAGAWPVMENRLLLAGMVSGLVTALFTYNLRMAPTAMPILALAALLTPGGVPVYRPPLPAAMLLIPVIGYLVWHFAGKGYLGNWYNWKAGRTKSPEETRKLVLKALEYAPKNNTYLSNAALAHQGYDPAAALAMCEKMIHHFDGEKVEWAVYDQYGRLAWNNHSLLPARAAFLTAVYLNPRYKPAYECLGQVNQTLETIQAQMKREEEKQRKAEIRHIKKKNSRNKKRRAG